MGKLKKLLQKILLGISDKNLRFNDLCWLLKKLGFEERIKGSHYIFIKDDVEEIINIQPKGNMSKPYQVK
ncbi:MAG: type II toxin-antitoxin system HicA family toxin [Candidatus Marinimicrobia bacterium]|nr:type II toxin-antitoxin system HicA family toxin [Candidatus Neomarinimicrobiota bacterium]